MSRYSSGMAMTTIHAPCTNLVTSTRTSTTLVAAAPVRLIACERCMARRVRPPAAVRSSPLQCRTMPAWLSVNDTNTPMM